MKNSCQEALLIWTVGLSESFWNRTLQQTFLDGNVDVSKIL